MQKHIMRVGSSLTAVDIIIQDFAEKLAGQESVDAIWKDTITAAEDRGFDYLIYMYMRPAAPQDNALILANMPGWWADYYLDENLAARDPFFKTCQTFVPRRIGSEFMPENTQMLTPGEQKFVLEASETGLRSGFSSPVRLVNPGHFGGWNFGSQSDRNGFQALFEAESERLQLMGFFAHEHLQRALVLTQQPNGTGKREPVEQASLLSNRERECLLWLSKGLRTGEIADHLGLATVTVDLHFKRARQKLKASTREEALAKAIINGEITP